VPYLDKLLTVVVPLADLSSPERRDVQEYFALSAPASLLKNPSASYEVASRLVLGNRSRTRVLVDVAPLLDFTRHFVITPADREWFFTHEKRGVFWEQFLQSQSPSDEEITRITGISLHLKAYVARRPWRYSSELRPRFVARVEKMKFSPETIEDRLSTLMHAPMSTNEHYEFKRVLTQVVRCTTPDAYGPAVRDNLRMTLSRAGLFRFRYQVLDVITALRQPNAAVMGRLRATARPSLDSLDATLANDTATSFIQPTWNLSLRNPATETAALVRAILNRHLDKLGHDPDEWRMFLVLCETWDGTIVELGDTIHAMNATPAHA
jgi:hypothetical protein